MGKKSKLKSPDKPNKKPKMDEVKPSKKLADKSFEEFVQDWDDDDDVSDVELEKQELKQPAKEKKLKKKKQRKAKSDENIKEDKKIEKNEEPQKKENMENDSSDKKKDNDSSDEEMAKSTGANKQKKYISSLKDKDPEFYKFLQKEDANLLNFDESSSEDDEKDDEEAVHELPDGLEVASDESDFEHEDEKAGSKWKEGKITREMVEEWTTTLGGKPAPKDIMEAVQAFRAAVEYIGSGKNEDEGAPCIYMLEGATMFNSVIRMCVSHLFTAIKSFLNQPNDDSIKPQKSKKWKRIDKAVRMYLFQLCTLLSRITEPSVAIVLLKHTHQMIPYFQMNVKGEKMLLTKLIKLWSQGEETVRVLALLCIVRAVRNNAELQERAIKAMFMAYVSNTKFTSPNTLPLINFMRRSLVEVYALDHKSAYFQAFIQIRQLAIHLRGALSTASKENLQTVCNWQYVHSLELWGALLSHARDSEELTPLIYPLTQVILGVLKLAKGSKYIPLRFHCATILTNLSSQTGTFIPVIPIYLDILQSHIFNKKSRKVSMKPIELACILKVAKSGLADSGFKECVIEEVYAGLITYLATQSNKIGFPELVTPMIFQLKDFMKTCKVGNFCKKMKQVLDKVNVNKDLVEKRRRKVTFGVGDVKQIEIWEAQLERDGTPLMAFYRSWKKVADGNMRKRMTHNLNSDDNIPIIKKKTTKTQEKEDEVTGFLSGSDDDMDDEERFKPKEERGKKVVEEEESDDGDDDEQSDDDQGEGVDDEGAKDVSDEESEGNDGDEVTDLRLEDFGDSDVEMMNDEFEDDAKSDGSQENDDDDDSD